MTQVHKSVEHRASRKTKEPDPLARIRRAAQELHGAISDAAAKRGEAMKVDLQTLPKRAEAVTASVRASLGAEGDSAKKHLEEAIKFLETTERHIAGSVRGTGQELEASLRRAVADARSAAQKISEAVAVKRGGEATKANG